MNRSIKIAGFAERKKLVLDEWRASGKSIQSLANKMGAPRTHMYDDYMWGSGKVARFCAVTGESADWLLGLRSNRYDR